MSLREYWRALRAHDWDYERSDDHGAYTRGSEEHHRLREEAKADFAHGQMWSAFNSHHLDHNNHIPPFPFEPGDPVRFNAEGLRVYHPRERRKALVKSVGRKRLRIQWRNTFYEEYIPIYLLELSL